MDGKFVAFGRLIEGEAVLAQLEAAPTVNQRPEPPCTITACGRHTP
jgi:hypothetical protein